jgi:hypothetical protein
MPEEVWPFKAPSRELAKATFSPREVPTDRWIRIMTQKLPGAPVCGRTFRSRCGETRRG